MRHEFIVLAIVLGGCAADGSASDPNLGETGGKADETASSSACKVIDMRSGAPGASLDPNAFTDALAAHVLVPGTICPEDFEATITKLRETDTRGCDGPRAGLTTAIVTEESQVTQREGFIRTVTSRTCDDREPFELLFSQFGLAQDDEALPENAEIIAFDRVAGAFNYYTIEEGQWGFHGSSPDFLEDDTKARCAGCHTGGGLIMKELPNPWVHWEGAASTPGSGDLIGRFASLGDHGDGAFMELDVVEPGNARWGETRIDHLLRAGSTKRLLEPLFCAVEVNVDTAADPLGIVPLFTLPTEALLDPHLQAGGVTSNEAVYAAILPQIGQRIEDDDGQPLQRANGSPALDTVLALAFPQRSLADTDHVQGLVDRGAIDTEFVADVLSVDMTRPVFSDERCALLEFAPSLDPLVDAGGAPAADLGTRIVAGFVANLEQSDPAPTSHAGQLLANLREAGDEDAHLQRAQDFIDACTSRDPEAFLRDYLEVVSLRRDLARKRQLFEFRASLPVDDLVVHEDTRLDPRTCVLVRGGGE